MAEPLTVEVPNADLAEELMRRLHGFPTELADDGTPEVQVMLVGNPDRAIGEVLNVVDRWLLENDLETVRVRLGERTYRLSAPQKPPDK